MANKHWTEYGDTHDGGREAYRDGYIMMGDESVTFDAGYWAEHDAEFIEQTEGFDGYEAAYGNFTDYDAVSQGFYDDDPNPYSGTYSEM